ncbi:hypothetical protein PQ478_08380 [Alkalihalophilus pseudofirmus]|uniref:hypothetical protein n=1 Tax=Alkalihalophilus pseudofirmus TaxID=79885 RepID=UPI00259B0917|nr:hypothetical protein [Alkalihalophilus pseudofirmus]WEG18485.1 hypothetical protein PQ478_08380 [Alkalihalophilus pseudofirmus]
MDTNIRRIYYDKETGDVLVERGFNGFVTPTSIEKDIADFKVLSERNANSYRLLEIPFTQYSQDFSEASSYRVNPETKELEFQYRDPNEPDVEQPYIKSLSEAVEEQMDYLLDVDFRLLMVEMGI